MPKQRGWQERVGLGLQGRLFSREVFSQFELLTNTLLSSLS